MSYINDPFELTQAPILKDAEVLDEEPPSLEEIFADTTGYYPDTVVPDLGIHVGVCRFNELGEHTYISEKCQHFRSSDQEGRRIVPGWTIQQNRR